MTNSRETQQKNKKFLIKLLISAILMFGFCYLMVPLYTLVCQQIGINGHVYQSSDTSPVLIDTSRTIRVDFSTGIHDNMHWQFKPLIHHITLHPGETKTVYFYAENDSGHEMTVQAIPSITPSDAAKYLKKNTMLLLYPANTGQRRKSRYARRVSPRP